MTVPLPVSITIELPCSLAPGSKICCNLMIYPSDPITSSTMQTVRLCLCGLIYKKIHLGLWSFIKCILIVLSTKGTLIIHVYVYTKAMNHDQQQRTERYFHFYIWPLRFSLSPFFSFIYKKFHIKFTRWTTVLIRHIFSDYIHHIVKNRTHDKKNNF